MKTIAIVGKVDSRILAYPLARALSLQGPTCIIADDGVYRRLYHGDERQGSINNIDISVGNEVNESLLASLSDTGTKYAYQVVVSNSFIPSEASGVIICTGIDKSMTADIDNGKDDEADEPVKKAPKKRGKSSPEDAASASAETTAETTVAPAPKKEVKRDCLVAPTGMKSANCIISFDSAGKSTQTAIQLKDTAIKYIFSCEETKRLQVLDDKAFNKTLATMAAPLLGMTVDDLFKLLSRNEYIKGGKTK